MANKIDVRSIAIQAGVTALVFALVNRMMPQKKGLGVSRSLLLGLATERMAQFADPGTMANIANAQFLKEQFSAIDIYAPETYTGATPQQIANVAFVAVHCPDINIRKMANTMLANFKKYNV